MSNRTRLNLIGDSGIFGCALVFQIVDADTLDIRVVSAGELDSLPPKMEELAKLSLEVVTKVAADIESINEGEEDNG